MIVQEIKDREWATRKASSEAILQNVPRDVFLLSGDEALFHLSGCVDKQNFRYCSPNNPIQIHERPLHSERVTIWCAVADFGIIGPYFFEENGKAVTVTSARYVDMLRYFPQSKLYEYENLAM
ncbi:hypothetical protein AVEN_173071-1 [Araneus ventricosus]|uniref:Uncharacterized protein n=1 Tax=Araneus ventricosus TaxID=182803 RepID=A0A4Y2HE86_ARAVE|nr:hypothetical protein AVEN_173071-1 [Araneus ventricosus]